MITVTTTITLPTEKLLFIAPFYAPAIPPSLWGHKKKDVKIDTPKIVDIRYRYIELRDTRKSGIHVRGNNVAPVLRQRRRHPLLRNILRCFATGKQNYRDLKNCISRKRSSPHSGELEYFEFSRAEYFLSKKKNATKNSKLKKLFVYNINYVIRARYFRQRDVRKI